jgi:hypothetical protein
MKKLLKPKVRVLLLACAGLLALVLLSAALRQLTFQPPLPFSFSLSGLLAPVNPGPGLTVPGWKYFLFGGLLLLILAVIMFFLDPELRKRILQRLVRLLIMLAALWFIITTIFKRGSLQQLFNFSPGGSANNFAAASQVGAPVFIPPQINPWLVLAVSFLVGLALVLVGWFIFTRRKQSGNRLELDEVAGIAADALQELGSGRNWDDAIVRAYIRMNEVVLADRLLIRQPGSTPREFAERMERMGLPGEAVRTLTGLFEAVRYGGRTSSPAERDLAAAALSAIVHSSRWNA